MEYVQRELPYVRSFVLRSVYGVLRQEGITFGEEEPGRVIAEWREDGTDVSLSITAEEKAFGTELTVSLRRPCDEEGGRVNRLMSTVGTTYIGPMFGYRDQGGGNREAERPHHCFGYAGAGI